MLLIALTVGQLTVKIMMVFLTNIAGLLLKENQQDSVRKNSSIALKQMVSNTNENCHCIHHPHDQCTALSVNVLRLNVPHKDGLSDWGNNSMIDNHEQSATQSLRK